MNFVFILFPICGCQLKAHLGECVVLCSCARSSSLIRALSAGSLCLSRAPGGCKGMSSLTPAREERQGPKESWVLLVRWHTHTVLSQREGGACRCQGRMDGTLECGPQGRVLQVNRSG